MTTQERIELANDYDDPSWLTCPEPTPPTPADRARTALEELARLCHDADAVARHLEDHQCFGLQNCSSACPLYVWIREQYGVESDVSDPWVTVSNGIKITMPVVICDFVRNFDEGRYPALVARTV